MLGRESLQVESQTILAALPKESAGKSFQAIFLLETK
jgi:hypothetical protein